MRRMKNFLNRKSIAVFLWSFFFSRTVGQSREKRLQTDGTDDSGFDLNYASLNILPHNFTAIQFDALLQKSKRWRKFNEKYCVNCLLISSHSRFSSFSSAWGHFVILLVWFLLCSSTVGRIFIANRNFIALNRVLIDRCTVIQKKKLYKIDHRNDNFELRPINNFVFSKSRRTGTDCRVRLQEKWKISSEKSWKIIELPVGWWCSFHLPHRENDVAIFNVKIPFIYQRN